MQPESELDQCIAREDLNALISSDKLQRLRSKELVVRFGTEPDKHRAGTMLRKAGPGKWRRRPALQLTEECTRREAEKTAIFEAIQPLWDRLSVSMEEREEFQARVAGITEQALAEVCRAQCIVSRRGL